MQEQFELQSSFQCRGAVLAGLESILNLKPSLGSKHACDLAAWKKKEEKTSLEVSIGPLQNAI
jgi:hypothetical protein